MMVENTKRTTRDEQQQQMNQKNHLMESLDRKSCRRSAGHTDAHYCSRVTQTPTKSFRWTAAKDTRSLSHILFRENVAPCSAFLIYNSQHKTIFYCLYTLYMCVVWCPTLDFRIASCLHCFTSFTSHNYSQSMRQSDRRSYCSTWM